ncbi:hypothetical protein Cgig2_029992 [Carnegiea gigantea]|uniref:Uncharacterized protein n=1 Tax=Carnegiea gigantea TaxID=171969 RepID=A0A9Q1K644_9CARY|nr:hypothetical protein Cgig2_029992 [Carnegiea gigantea]
MSQCFWIISNKKTHIPNMMSQWCVDFYMLYKLDTREEYECQWSQVLGKYNSTYPHGYFFGGMTTTRRSKFLNGFTRRFVSSNITLRDIAKQVDLVVRRLHKPNYITIWYQILVYSHHEKNKPCKFSPLPLFKSYKNKLLNQAGAQCSMYVSVIVINSIHRLTLHVLLEDGSSQLEISNEQETIRQDATLMGNDLNNKDNILCPPKSTTKGQPRKSHMKGGKELKR